MHVIQASVGGLEQALVSYAVVEWSRICRIIYLNLKNVTAKSKE